MPLAAIAAGTSDVACTDGTQNGVCAINPTKWTWSSPLTSSSGAATATKVMLDLGRPVLQGDVMASHPDGVPCVVAPVNHSPPLTTYSNKVNIEGKWAGRIGDLYDDENGFTHTITTGSGKVTFG